MVIVCIILFLLIFNCLLSLLIFIGNILNIEQIITINIFQNCQRLKTKVNPFKKIFLVLKYKNTIKTSYQSKKYWTYFKK